MTRSRQRLVTAAVIIGWWTLLAVLFAPQSYLLNLRSRTPLTWTQAFLANAAMFYTWAALTPIVLWLASRFPFDRGRRTRAFAVHLFGAPVITAAHLAAVRYLNPLLISGAAEYQPPVPAIALLVGYGATDIMIYGGLVAVGHAIDFFHRFQDREFRLVEAQLQSLRTQLHPHFLFNTMNAIAELIYQDPPRAERTLTQLSDLLRMALEGGDAHQVTLREELAFLQKYLEVQRTLLQDRLEVVWTVQDQTLDARVPAMLLQPLVENSIRHGIARRVEGGTVSITARAENRALVLEVEDNGPGFVREQVETGVGLGNSIRRLEHLYPGRHEMSITAGAGGRGARVTLRIPFERVEETRE